MNRLRTFFLFSFLSLVIVGLSLASERKTGFTDWDDEDFRVEAEALDPDVADFLQEQSHELQAFRDERDRDFAEFLQESWKEFSEFDGIRRDTQPKPVNLPRMKESPLLPERKGGDTIVAIEEPKPSPPVKPLPKDEPVVEKKEPPVKKPLLPVPPSLSVVPVEPLKKDDGQKDTSSSPSANRLRTCR